MFNSTTDYEVEDALRCFHDVAIVIWIYLDHYISQPYLQFQQIGTSDSVVLIRYKCQVAVAVCTWIGAIIMETRMVYQDNHPNCHDTKMVLPRPAESQYQFAPLCSRARQFWASTPIILPLFHLLPPRRNCIHLDDGITSGKCSHVNQKCLEVIMERMIFAYRQYVTHIYIGSLYICLVKVSGITQIKVYIYIDEMYHAEHLILCILHMLLIWEVMSRLLQFIERACS